MIIKKLIYLLLFFLVIAPACTKKKAPVQVPLVEIIHESHPHNWYPHESGKLTGLLDELCKNTHRDLRETADKNQPFLARALIVPHGHYRYSSFASATAYQKLLFWQNKNSYLKNNFFNRVIILAPCHFFELQGIALPDYTHYKTPLGTLSVDQEALKILAAHHGFHQNKLAHGQDHSIDLQLPFLQHCLEKFTIVPLFVGHISPAFYPGVLEQLRKIIDTRTLVVVSSDFSHYGCYKDADNQQKISTALMRSWDSSVIQALIKKEWHQFQKIRKREGLSVCGNDALSLLLALYSYPETIDYKAQLLAYYSSYSITQLLQAQAPITLESLIEKNQDATISMGINYASMIYFDAEQLPHFTSYEKHALRYIAQKTLALSFTHVSLSVDELLPLVTPAICQKMGCFVTITDKNNVLRGCVGKIVTNEPLYETVMAMTQAAAFQDTRFDQITADEILDLNLEITIITEPRKVVNLNTFSPGRDGIILKKGEHEALFFPHVALENNWSKKKTLEELSLKAGLKPDEWKKGCSLELFSCITI